MKIERMFSKVEEEKLYSTGNDELDELLERAFCEGYEYAQKEFARRDYEGLSEEYAAKLREHRSKLAQDLNFERNLHNGTLKRHMSSGKMRPDEFARRNQKHMESLKDHKEMASDARQNLLKKQTKENVRKTTEEKLQNFGKEFNKGLENAINSGKQNTAAMTNKIRRAGKIGLGVTLGAAAIGTGVAIKKHNNKKKEEK